MNTFTIASGYIDMRNPIIYCPRFILLPEYLMHDMIAVKLSRGRCGPFTFIKILRSRCLLRIYQKFHKIEIIMMDRRETQKIVRLILCPDRTSEPFV